MSKTNEKLLNNSILSELAQLIITDGNYISFINANKFAFENITPYDVFGINAFIGENEDISTIKDIAGKLINLFRNGLLRYKWNKDISVIKKLLDEGRAIKDKFNELKEFVKARDFEGLRNNIEIIDELKKRFLKMQNPIFSTLEERLDNPKPLKVMWELYDDVSVLHKELIEALDNKTTDLNKIIGNYFFLVLGIIEKEELLILPILSDKLSNSELLELEYEIDSYGYAFLKEESAITVDEHIIKSEEYLFESKNGKLTLDELISILGTVGDITFVDSNNKVKFFNTPHGHFARSASIIGRDVRNCHPEKSIHVVNEIIDKFKKGTEDRVDFWINIKGALILISYFAIRDKFNKYLGVLELTQDISKYKNIEGERRILDFDWVNFINNWICYDIIKVSKERRLDYD